MAWQPSVRPVVEDVMRSRSVPGMVIAVARGDGQPDHLVVGVDGAGRPLGVDSLFPVASITKLVTALASLRLVARGKLTLDDPLTRHLPEAAAAVEGVTVRRLLSHTAGLPYDVAAEAAPYAPGLDWPRLEQACLSTPLVAPPGTTARYSNVGLGLVGIIVGRLTGQPIRQALAELVLAPLGIEGAFGTEPPRQPARIAGDYGRHEGSDLEPFNSQFWRALAMPWACLVTTAAGALTLARAFGGRPSGFLPPELLGEATTDQSGGVPGSGADLPWSPAPWGLGVEVRGAKEPHVTPVSASPASFGHAGASGCLAWADPDADVAWPILGARTFDTWWPDWAGIGEALLTTSSAERRMRSAAFVQPVPWLPARIRAPSRSPERPARRGTNGALRRRDPVVQFLRLTRGIRPPILPLPPSHPAMGGTDGSQAAPTALGTPRSPPCPLRSTPSRP